LIGGAVEELLRYDGSVQLRGLRAVEDFAIDGKHILKGQRVLLALGAANRDPAQFPEPDQLDIGRHDNRHLDLGRGIHFCIGAALARTEIQIAIASLLRRMPDLRLASQTLEWQPIPIFRGPMALPLLFDSTQTT
jgi:cytochrome P450